MAEFKDETGKRYGKLTVIRQRHRSKRKEVRWLCKCDCGNELTVSGGNLRCGGSTSCGCSRVINEIGKRYGKLVVIERFEIKKSSRSQAHWLCKCDCGKETVVIGKSLRNGHTKSCGCLRKERGKMNDKLFKLSR